ncbi:hypothetical protein [Curtobacterium sp. 9128]|uniref:hypothetical protein n=1 Tax=Curtobacterium sp. 9128 TaxID=1793722 RepID=UPI0011A784EE|nr:hypothetical protein [Curtobacterium sp. 9128]
MTTTTTNGSSGADRRGAVWLVLAAALTIAVVLGPAAVAGWATGTHLSVAALPEAVASGFAAWVRSGRASSAPLADAVAFWAVFHAVKAVVAIALLVVLVPVGRRLWGAYARARSGGRRALLLLVGVLGAPVAPVVLLMTMANVQGAVAPLSSVLTFLPMDGPAVGAVRSALAGGVSTPPVATLVDDFRVYHAALVVTAVAAIVVVAALTVVVWVRRTRTPEPARRLRRVLAAAGVLLPGLLLFLGIVLVANLSTVADTAPALAAFFDGSGT